MMKERPCQLVCESSLSTVNLDEITVEELDVILQDILTRTRKGVAGFDFLSAFNGMILESVWMLLVDRLILGLLK